MEFKNFLIISISSLGMVFIASVGISWLFARQFCRPKRRLPKKTPGVYGLDYEEINFSSQGVSIDGWFIPARGDARRRPTIVVAHGWSANAAQVLPIARSIIEAGGNTLLYNARGHGTSADDGPITLQKFAEDLIAAISYLEQRKDVDMDRVGVVGHSMGGSASIVAASMDGRIRALVSSAAFADPEALTREFMKVHRLPRGPLFHLVSFFINRWLHTSMSDIAPKNRIGRIQAPIFLIHGDADAVISPKNMEILQSQSSNGVVNSWLMNGGLHHSTIIRDPEYAPRIVEFFDQHLFSGHTGGAHQIYLAEFQDVTA